MAARVLVIGSGGREHALAWKLAASPHVEQVFVAPGNDGMREIACCLPARDLAGWRAAAREHGVDLVVVGPEDPLVAGVADVLRAEGHLVFGPGAEAARLEGDKSFAKDFMVAAGIPTADAERFEDLPRAIDYVRGRGGPCVVKACGLAAGKGVAVCDDPEQAEAALRMTLGDRAFGDAGASVLVEERLVGRELSVFAVLDGERSAFFLPSRDHKRLRDGDAGPNTGGMGAYCPVGDATEPLMRQVEETVIGPSIAELRRRNLDYRGLLYVGLMLTAEGPKVLEYNCRFGDPETQVVLPAFSGDLYPLLLDAARGALGPTGALPSRGAAVGIVLAAPGYPSTPERGIPIPGLAELRTDDLVFHAGTRFADGTWQTAGGRVLCAVGQGEGLETANRRARELAQRLRFAGAQIRTDIGRYEEGGAA